jgi:mono/diheme cytochrome c family protein
MNCNTRPILIAIVLLAGNATAGEAQNYGEAARGMALATQMCVGCHGLKPGDLSDHSRAPPFAVIAATRGMSEMALNVALTTPHQAMPNIMLEPQQRADIVAYILSLRAQ